MGTKDLTHEAISAALANGDPLTHEQRATLLGLVADDKAWQRKHDELAGKLAALRERWKREPVAAQSRFPGVAWSQCDVEHARMVLANPSEWPGYQVRLLCEWVGPNFGLHRAETARTATKE
jgi:hypothetical protein